MLVRGHRREREELRRDGLLQVDHQAHHTRLVLPDAQAFDVRIVGADLADQLAQRGAQLEPVDVDHEPVRVIGEKVLRGQRRVGLDRHACVVGGGPDPHRDDARAERELARAEQQGKGAHRAQGLTACGGAVAHDNNSMPRAVCAR